ncbi:hypothetical protein DMB95_00060 [Campylobacter sp. MIT 12-8780]|uniref:hypothetical protein n=1 Tax=unclassified Campylobacter TaxID=2593542 RepID=UPI00115CF829|nr:MULTISPECIES: hypothetical protein [unclassified Campylobacter]NDJ26352.1 hypothetical protein [Campylobacter sp. MIT 19-121]TQR42929.1 hypothetical protein DMB95_00060 [Campylobacter sp. MIT 12-8780]
MRLYICFLITQEAYAQARFATQVGGHKNHRKYWDYFELLCFQGLSQTNLNEHSTLLSQSKGEALAIKEGVFDIPANKFFKLRLRLRENGYHYYKNKLGRTKKNYFDNELSISGKIELFQIQIL